jgi:large subunit ribosomal protein L4
MTKATVYNQKGEKKGEVTLNKDVFGHEVNEGLIHRALILQMANSRKPIAHTKTRGEIRGGGRKPHAQKGTGRARFGSIRTPIHRGGGIVFGPRNDRNFSVAMPKKQRRKALFCALSSKANDNQVMVLEEYKGAVKTKEFASLVSKLPVDRNVLVVVAGKDDSVEKSARNLTNVKTIHAGYLNVKDLLKYKSVLFLSDALTKVEDTFLSKNEKAPAKKAAPKKAEKAETTKEA